MAVAGLTLPQGLLCLALQGDVDASGDDEGDVFLSVGERGCRPLDEAGVVVAGRPAILVFHGKGAAAHAIEADLGGGPVLGWNQGVPQGVADNFFHGPAGDGFADAIEADDATGGVVDDDQCADSVEHGGDEVSLDGEGGFDALAAACLALVEAGAQAQFQPGHDGARKGAQGVALYLVEDTRLRGEDAQAAHG